MAYVKKPPNAALAVGSIVMLLTLAGIYLAKNNYGGPGLGDTWPALGMAVGVCFLVGGMLEMGILLTAGFGLWLGANLDWLSGTQLWPFILVLIALLVAVGYIRARAEHDKKAKG
jgi:uncharacterized membrane protein (DUF485 family)